MKEKRPRQNQEASESKKKRNHGEDATRTILAGARTVKRLADDTSDAGKWLEMLGGGRMCDAWAAVANATPNVGARKHQPKGTFGRGGKCFQ